MHAREMFNKHGAIYVQDVLPVQLIEFLTHVLLRQRQELQLQNISTDDSQVPGALAVMGSTLVFDTINERIWPFLENILGEELIPTYSYARLYTNGNVLESHKDRPSCEISITIQLGRSHHYSWPIYAGGQRFDLAEGDAMLYKGCEVEHWRDACAGPPDYYSGQVFCHFVRAQGPYAHYMGDGRWTGVLPFERYRTLNMETK
jgi:hypothetical protein